MKLEKSRTLPLPIKAFLQGFSPSGTPSAHVNAPHTPAQTTSSGDPPHNLSHIPHTKPGGPTGSATPTATTGRGRAADNYTRPHPAGPMKIPARQTAAHGYTKPGDPPPNAGHMKRRNLGPRTSPTATQPDRNSRGAKPASRIAAPPHDHKTSSGAAPDARYTAAQTPRRHAPLPNGETPTGTHCALRTNLRSSIPTQNRHTPGASPPAPTPAGGAALGDPEQASAPPPRRQGPTATCGGKEIPPPPVRTTQPSPGPLASPSLALCSAPRRSRSAAALRRTPPPVSRRQLPGDSGSQAASPTLARP